MGKISSASHAEHGLQRQLGLRDLVLAQVLCVVGSRLGRSGSGAGQGAGADLGGGNAAVLFSDGGSGDRPQPDYAAGREGFMSGRIGHSAGWVGFLRRGTFGFTGLR